jgi:hypothetical protein
MGVYMIEDDFRAIGLSMGLREVAAQDAWLQFATFDGSAREFFTARKEDKPHWFATQAADTVEHTAFYSVEAQAAYCKEHGEAATRELLATEGLKLGQIKAAKVEDADSIPGARNPYSDQFRGTEAEREARITSIIRHGGARLATSLALSAGKTITNQPLRTTGQRR